MEEAEPEADRFLPAELVRSFGLPAGRPELPLPLPLLLPLPLPLPPEVGRPPLAKELVRGGGGGFGPFFTLPQTD